MKKARRMAGWVLRTFYSIEDDCMLTLLRALIQPKLDSLDYCCQLWSPHKAADIQALESVQRAYTRQIRGLKDLPYWDRLKKLGQYSQQRRRDRYICRHLHMEDLGKSGAQPFLHKQDVTANKFTNWVEMLKKNSPHPSTSQDQDPPYLQLMLQWAQNL
ncbi:hypothetical protein Pcinc_014196 [Petrolisthes cinctipes]|uniref:Uncharacterized protein n=1 Tax=Petrolisthes cinctipes TaxID=88211 RepID=A0AAE1KTH7_PETCI|nr:hypothetical protein Pcinc_014196 [Petrolisthes cinctipes]